MAGEQEPPPYEVLARHGREQIAASGVAGSGETGFQVEGRLAWVHCARTGNYTLLMA